MRLREPGSVSGPLIIAILAISVLFNLLCFIAIARLVKSVRKNDAKTPMQILKQVFTNREPHLPPASTPDVEENGPIIKNSVKKPFLPKRRKFSLKILMAMSSRSKHHLDLLLNFA